MCCSDPVDHHTYFIPGLYAAKVNLQWVYPLYTCGEGVAKGHRFCQWLRFPGSRGTGSRCQLNRGINPGPLYSAGPSGFINSKKFFHIKYVVEFDIFLPVLRNGKFIQFILRE